MKKILIFSTAYKPLVGGAEIAVAEIAKRLSSDYLFFMITYRFDKNLPAYEHEGSLEIHRLGSGTVLDRWLLFPFLAFWKAREIHVRHRIDLMWGVMVSYATIGAYFLKLFHPRLPLLLTLQEGDPVEHLTYGKLGLLGFWWKLLVRKADYIQAISSYLADIAVSKGARNRIAVVPNGVNVEHFSAPSDPPTLEKYRQFFGFTEGDYIIVTVSRLAAKNAVDVIIRALTHLDSRVKLLIVGTGELKKQLQDLAGTLNLSGRVIFVGQVTHRELPDYLHLAKVFVRPSRSEGLGNAFLEAMAAGVPVVGTSVGGIRDFLKDGETGMVCQPDDASGLAERINRLQSDQALARKLSESASAFVRSRYDWQMSTDSMKKIIEELVS